MSSPENITAESSFLLKYALISLIPLSCSTSDALTLNVSDVLEKIPKGRRLTELFILSPLISTFLTSTESIVGLLVST